MEKIEAILCDNDRGIILTHGDKEKVHLAYIELSTVYEMNHLSNNLEIIDIKKWLRGYYYNEYELKCLSEDIIILSYEYVSFFKEVKKLVEEHDDDSYGRICQLISLYKKIGYY